MLACQRAEGMPFCILLGQTLDCLQMFAILAYARTHTQPSLCLQLFLNLGGGENSILWLSSAQQKIYYISVSYFSSLYMDTALRSNAWSRKIHIALAISTILNKQQVFKVFFKIYF
jgi:hypothetical protein